MKIFSITILLICTIFLGACDSASETTGASTENEGTGSAAAYQKISAEEAYQMMLDNDDYILLDVRTEQEFAESHIEGAILIPHTDITSKAAEYLPDKDALILVYCRRGNRSATAAHTLIDIGYSNVYDFGGIEDWPYDTASK